MASGQVLQKEQLMKTPKHAYLGEETFLLLIRYSESSDSYDGIAFKIGNLKVNVIGGTEGESAPGFGKTTAFIPNAEFVTGLRPYPYHSRPDYPKQFVEFGDDVQPLIEIADRAAKLGQGPMTNLPGTDPAPDKPESDDMETVEVDTDSDQRGSNQQIDKPTGGDAQTFHSADTNQSGGIDEKEAKRHRKQTGGKLPVTEKE